MEETKMSFEGIRPFVRFAQDVHVRYQETQIPVIAYDHRLFYILSGNGSVRINAAEEQIGPGTVLYWMSGTEYSIFPAERSGLRLIAINFDLTWDNSAAVQYLPMAHPQEFQPERQLEHIRFTDAAALNDTIILQEATSLLPYLQTMVREATYPELYSSSQLSSLMRIVLTILFRSASTRQTSGDRGGSFRTILEYIQAHYSEELDNTRLGKLFNYNPYYISQMICEHTGTPLHQYLLKVRIRQAIYLLETTQLPVAEIAQQVGFKSTSYFSQYFKKSTGYSPSAFRVK